MIATTDYRREHSFLFWGFAAANMTSIGIRVVLAGLGERVHVLHPGLRNAAFVAAVGLASFSAGCVHASALWYYGLASWPYVITMLWIVGCASGSIISLTPSLRLIHVYLWTAWAPVFSMYLRLGGLRGYTVALTTFALFCFLFTQGRGLHKAYWRQLRGRALERTRAEELELAKAAAEAASLAKSRFLANMSHEIRTPMHGVLGLAHLALSSETLRDAREQVDSLCGAAEGLLHLINDILDFSKIEAGKMTLERIPFPLPRMLDELGKLMAPQARAKGLDLRIDTAGGVPAVVVGDPARLRQVLVNLLGNAIKFTSDGSVTLEVAWVPTESDSHEANLRFLVSDTGIGIPAEHQHTIFEAFGQADSSVTRRFGGSGLGLTICRQLVELMGGRIRVESTSGAGSTFHFTCAVGIAGPGSLAEPTAEVAEEPHGLRILLAEDNAVNQRVATAILGKHGHRVTVVSTGVEAVEAWEAEEFDVILTDNQMPKMGGMEAVRYIREREATTNRKRTPVVVLSASATIGDRERFLSAGMDRFLAKPFCAAELYSTLREIMPPPAAEEPVIARG